jgi:hypothetical protein
MQYLNFEILKNGNLAITATKDGIELIADSTIDNKPSQCIWGDLMEYTSCNGSYCLVEPEEISALTESIIIADGYYYELPDDMDPLGESKYFDKVWWLPDYCLRNELEELLLGETVEFILAD